MADFADDDELNTTAAVEGSDADTEAEADEVSVTIEGEGDAAPASEEESGTQLVRILRQQTREQAKELAKLRAQQQPAPVAVDPGPKPTLESCGWEEETFEARLDEWKDAKAKAAEAVKAQQSEAERAQADWQADLTRYAERKAALRIPDYQDAEDTVISTLSAVQQAVVVKAAGDPALVIAALGKHPAKLAELQKIADPIKLAVAVSKLEGSLKVVTRNAPRPESIVRGTASVAGGKVDKHLERLEAEADRTGDRTKVVAYRKSLKA